MNYKWFRIIHGTIVYLYRMTHWKCFYRWTCDFNHWYWRGPGNCPLAGTIKVVYNRELHGGRILHLVCVDIDTPFKVVYPKDEDPLRDLEIGVWYFARIKWDHESELRSIISLHDVERRSYENNPDSSSVDDLSWMQVE